VGTGLQVATGNGSPATWLGTPVADMCRSNTEQLAGTLCQEVSHTIHPDSISLMEKEKKIERREVAAAILLGPTRASYGQKTHRSNPSDRSNSTFSK
jgi:hypothetical protein